MIPRWIHRLYARLAGYFWLPCSMCGRWFGGHEECGFLDTSPHGGVMVCIKCASEAKKVTQRRWKKWFPKGLQ